jgi:DNA-binding protein YbaB
MFGGVKNAIQGVGNLSKAQQTQAKYQKMMQEIRVSGISKNGKVTIEMSGEQKLTNVKIDPSLITFVNDNYMNSDDQNNIVKGQKMISDAILEASEDAVSKVQTEMIKKIQENGGLGEMMEMFQSMK